uniref:Uncharacterized LOC100175852 n=1 Tax=Ciona intestinalis TaxID=7719 RepID=H2XZ61_CIOIN|nr:uncharacterized protein LOC100175852 [Ciona intestinalis]|eukprot:XP_009857711.1 uncharacterized protein LOC100175852 [Ciona intestinalis]
MSVTYTTQPVIYPVEPELPGKKYKTAYTVLGCLQIFIGVLSIILSSVVLANATAILSQADQQTQPSVNSAAYYIYSGIGSGLWYIVAGILGVVSGRRPSSCPITGALVITIFAAITAGSMAILQSLTSAGISGAMTVLTRDSIGTIFEPSDPAMVEVKSFLNQTLIIYAVLAVLAFMEFIITIVHSGFCCAVKCCNSQDYRGMVTGTTTITTMQNPIQMQAQPAYDPNDINMAGAGYGYSPSPNYSDKAGLV